MTRYLISFDDGAMTFPEEDLPDVAEAAHAVVQEANDAGVWVFGGGLHSHEEVSVVATDGTVTDGPIPGEQGVHRRILGCRCSLTRAGAGVGWQDRRRLPLRAEGSRVRARLYALIKAIRERRRKAFRVSPFAHHRLCQRAVAREAREAVGDRDNSVVREPTSDARARRVPDVPSQLGIRPTS